MPARTTTTVLVACRINVDATWADACIHEVASRLIVISSAASLRVGSYVDVRRGTLIVIGRVIWVREQRVGIRTQDPVSASALVSEPRLSQRPTSSEPHDRRGPARQRAPRSAAMQAERSRRLSSAMQYAALTAAASAGTYLLASQLYVALTVPFARLSAVLGN